MFALGLVIDVVISLGIVSWRSILGCGMFTKDGMLKFLLREISSCAM